MTHSLPWERKMGAAPAEDHADVDQATEAVNNPPPAPPATTNAALDLNKVIDKAVPIIQKSVADYASQLLMAKIFGQGSVPDLAGTTVNGKEFRTADARNRAFRTLWQNLLIDLGVALIAFVGSLGSADFFSKEGLTLIGLSLGKTVIATVISFIARLKVEPKTVIDGDTVDTVAVVVPSSG